MSTGRARLVLAAGLCAGPLSAAAFHDGAPPAHTGGFGEPSCLACHFDHEPNPPGGTLEVLGYPDAWEPGRSYEIRITLSGSDLAVAGFQLSVRTVAGNRPARGTGTVRPARQGIRVYEHAGVIYAQHTADGTSPAAPDSAHWQVVWSAPDAGAGTIVLNVAANFGNGDDSQFGDRVYLAELHSAEATR